jgi:hypothetical protein
MIKLKRINIISLSTVAVLLFTLIGCSCPKKNTTLLSAGQTEKPSANYKGNEATHNDRIKEPYIQLKPVLSREIPHQLKPHSRLLLTDVEDRPFFDVFAWQTFIGLVWPVDSNHRGVPNQHISGNDFLQYNTTDSINGNKSQIVWESFRTFDEALPNDSSCITSPPEHWNKTPYDRPFYLDKVSKTAHGSLDEAFSSPLIDQNKQYVRYNLQMNEVMYEYIRHNKWFLKENLPKAPTQASLPPLPVDSKTKKILPILQPQTNTVITQPINGNSITIKSAWRIMILKTDTTNNKSRIKDDTTRYFTVRADFRDAVTSKPIKNQLVGLVGLHVVVKTPQFTQGIWSSFEHVDNVKVPRNSKLRPSFNNGKGNPNPQGFSYIPDTFDHGQGKVEHLRKPVEVSRVYKIPDTPIDSTSNPHFKHGLSTVGLNKTYQGLLKGTVWENYQLVITQWPTDPTTFYPKPFLYPRSPNPDSKSLPAVKQAYARAEETVENSYPKWSGLPIPQVGALNTVMETYFQNPNPDTSGNRQPMENTSCMGCHYGASDTDYSWGLKLRTFPQPYNQGRLHPTNDSLLRNYIIKLPKND